MFLFPHASLYQAIHKTQSVFIVDALKENQNLMPNQLITHNQSKLVAYDRLISYYKRLDNQVEVNRCLKERYRLERLRDSIDKALGLCMSCGSVSEISQIKQLTIK